MKKFKKLSAVLSVILCMSMLMGMGTVFAVEESAGMPIKSGEEQIIGEYDGLLSDVIGVDATQQIGFVNVRIRSYAQYDTSGGVQVHIKLYTPDLFTNARFTGMTGTVEVLLHRTSTNTFSEFEDGVETIETDVDSGNVASSGTKGYVNVYGVATAYTALAGGGVFSISYEVTIP